jgi:ATP-dependent Lon protease
VAPAAPGLENPVTSRKRERTEFRPQDLPGELPILPLRNSVFFPGAVMPLTIGRAKTIRLIEEVTRENSLLGIVTQKAPEIDDPTPEDMSTRWAPRRASSSWRARARTASTSSCEGIARFRVDEFNQDEPFFLSKITPLMDQGLGDVEADALALNAQEHGAGGHRPAAGDPGDGQAARGRHR